MIVSLSLPGSLGFEILLIYLSFLLFFFGREEHKGRRKVPRPFSFFSPYILMANCCVYTLPAQPTG